MVNFFLKDIKLLLRDRTELLVIFLMPFILMLILGFALKGVLGGGESTRELEVALVEEDNSNEGKAQFVSYLEEQEIPTIAKEQIIEASNQIAIPSIIHTILTKELTEIVAVELTDKETADEKLAAKEIDAIITIPEGFTYTTLKHVLLQEADSANLLIKKGEHAVFDSSIVENILSQIAQSINLETAIAKESQSTEIRPTSDEVIKRETETITNGEPVSSMEYYSIGMAVMFAFFIASTMAAKSYSEQTQHVLDRIILSGRHPLQFLIGKLFAVIMLVFFQVNVLFVLSSLIMQSFQPISWQTIGIMELITFFYALAISAIACLLIALTLRLRSQAVSSSFTSGIVSVLALLGGSFTPITTFPEVIQMIGSWTPNGMTLRAYMLASQGLPFADIVPYVIRLSWITVFIFILSVVLFPNRRVAA
jgi:ABC-2 type transport system permease protein